MVGEFPELQGIMGEYYALHDGETNLVATALREQYLPRFSGDALPETVLGQTLAIADRIDTLVGIFGIDQVPTGDKDPFGLRRAALGILRMMIECALPLDLEQLLTKAQSNYPKEVLLPQTSQMVLTFVLERLRSYYQDRGICYDTLDAVLAVKSTSPLDVDRRIQGVEAFRTQLDALSLATANKRIHNILKKTDQSFPAQPNPTYFMDAVERRLYDAMETVNEQITPLIDQGDYQMALQTLATLRQPVDDFFDKVMVMDEDLKVRTNRLAFLQAIRNVFLRVADISQLQM
jgi:glycyl-tRNA synthetase beta chain